MNLFIQKHSISTTKGKLVSCVIFDQNKMNKFLLKIFFCIPYKSPPWLWLCVMHALEWTLRAEGSGLTTSCPCHLAVKCAQTTVSVHGDPGLTHRVQSAPGSTYNSRFEGRLDLLLLQEHPVDLLEERVLLDGVLAVLGCHTAQALVRVLGHELRRWGHRHN